MGEASHRVLESHQPQGRAHLTQRLVNSEKSQPLVLLVVPITMPEAVGKNNSGAEVFERHHTKKKKKKGEGTSLVINGWASPSNARVHAGSVPGQELRFLRACQIRKNKQSNMKQKQDCSKIQ